jgi:uncharacterized OB-fold protein
MSLSDADVLARYPDSVIDEDNIEYFRGLTEHELRVKHCRACGAWMPVRHPICPTCWSSDIGIEAVRGVATVFMFTILHVGPEHSDIDYDSGYPLATVEFVQHPGVRITGRVIDCPREFLRIGLTMELTWRERGAAVLPAFRPAASVAESTAVDGRANV